MFNKTYIRQLWQTPKIRLLIILLMILLLGLVLKPVAEDEVIMAAHSLEEGHALSNDDYYRQRLPRRQIPTGAINSDQQSLIIGKRLRRVVGQGEVITWAALEGADLRPSSEIPTGMRLIAVNIANLMEMRPYLRNNERVDLIFSPEAVAGKASDTYTFMRNIAIQLNSDESMGTSLGFIVPIKEAMLLLQAEKMGAFSVVLRNAAESSAVVGDNKINSSRDQVMQLLQPKRQPKTSGIEIIYGDR